MITWSQKRLRTQLEVIESILNNPLYRIELDLPLDYCQKYRQNTIKDLVKMQIKEFARA
jgi:hypothetical protein